MSGKVHALHGNQMLAVDPADTVWLSASAGTGKTQVLASRVLRLLLREDVSPSQILCLTFTKAGATEMASRINETLAGWVRLGDEELFARLESIGAPAGPRARAHARTLFAAVLDCPGGGLRIDTIHAFSQWLLAAFPREAGLLAGARPMEDRGRSLLARQVLAELLVQAESEPLGDPQLLLAAADLSLRSGPEAVEKFLMRCASARGAWFGPGAWQEPMRPHVLRLLGLPFDADEEWLAAQCADDAFDVASVQRCVDANRAWGTATGLKFCDAAAAWLGQNAAGRLARLHEFCGLFLTAKGEPKSTRNVDKVDPEYAGYFARVIECLSRIAEARGLLDLADRLVPALRLGRAFALAWDAAKAREGLIDFDDQIALAAQLLGQSEQADWIRYKLDRQFDHILVDEAQDTNAAQWSIIDALTGDFFAGLGQRDERLRTLFVVGDYKQAIFRFQGTSPENFEKARQRVRERMRGAAENALTLRSNLAPRELVELGLDQSFRTATEVLGFVDAAIAAIQPKNFGIDAIAPHKGQSRPGYVALWKPVDETSAFDGDDPDDEEGSGGDWLSKPDRQMADRIARQVREWLDPEGPGLWLHKGARRAHAGDVMVLVRKRKELAALIVARLHAHGVAVAGVDRLRLGAPLAVQDLIAALRFAAQPLDDLNLAGLLVSPLVGWSQEQLLKHGWRGKNVRLWHHIGDSKHPEAMAAAERLRALLRLADFEPPQALLHWLLVGPWQGRRRLLARLGGEAGDPIDELLNAASAYAATATPSLAGFLAWFDASDEDLKRESDGAAGQVRVMTAHGSKGLQAPIVILADATGNPDSGRDAPVGLADPFDADRVVPLPPLAKEEKAGRIREAMDEAARADEQEHWRLLYVAMTRAEEALFVGGALGLRDKGVPPPKSWFAALRGLLGEEHVRVDAVWGERWEWGTPPVGAPAHAPRQPAMDLREPLPEWLHRARPEEPRPPRPLAPSSLGEDEAPDPPWPPGAGQEAARRGTLIHRLLERLPDVAPEERRSAGSAWLARQAADWDEAVRGEMLESALAVLDHPEWAEVFGPGTLAEVPVAAVVGGAVIAGTIDRLCVDGERVRIVDFKTARRPPASLEEVPRAVLRQMAAYAAALEATWPGRTVEAALLYTQAPRLIAIPADVLAAHKPDLAATQ